MKRPAVKVKNICYNYLMGVGYKKSFFALFGVVLLSAACGRTGSPSELSTDRTAKSVPQIRPGVAPEADIISANDIKTTQTGQKPPQFVVLAFDGSRSLNMWRETLDFAQEMRAKQTPVHFTYFLSGVYFLNYRKAGLYQPPKKPAGTSLIGFADSNSDVEKRVAYVNRAISEGHEIGSHLNGHFDGSKWQLADWRREFSQFNNLIFNLTGNNGVSNQDASRYTINLSPSDLIGFRAPDLGRNNALYQVLAENKYAYDTSGVGQPNDWPKKMDNGLWEFPLAQINYGSSTAKILSMDYNFYFKQSKAKDIVKRGEPKWEQFLNETYGSYLNYFSANYKGNRAPVFIGSHFSEWNDGVYWESLKKFARDVCGQPEVRCVSFKELMDFLNAPS